MKKSVLYFAALLCMMVQTVSTFANDKVVPEEQLPAAAQSFIQQAFPGQGITYVILDKDFGKTTYEVFLDNGVELEFDKNGTWDKVDCVFSAVPDDIIPASIADYVKAHFAGAKIVKIDKERHGYDVELSNDLELKFNRNGQLMDIDD